MNDITIFGELDSINVDTLNWGHDYYYYKSRPLQPKNLLITIVPKIGKGIYMSFWYPSGGSYRTREYNCKGKFIDEQYIP